jgi:hypothetical protein
MSCPDPVFDPSLVGFGFMIRLGLFWMADLAGRGGRWPGSLPDVSELLSDFASYGDFRRLI